MAFLLQRAKLPDGIIEYKNRALENTFTELAGVIRSNARVAELYTGL